jgi:hypothetical protein
MSSATMVRSLVCLAVSACTAPCLEGPASIYLSIEDSITAVPVADAVVQVSDPSGLTQTDTVRSGTVYPLMYGREPGDYGISIASAGYANWTRMVNVLSTDHGCKSVPATVAALLQRSP